jgi:hypothetical protein
MEEIVGCGFSPTTQSQVCLPFRFGGCGIKSCANHRLPWRLATIIHYMTNRNILQCQLTYDPMDVHDVLSALSLITPPNLEPLASWLSNQSLLGSSDPTYTRSKWWSDKIH